MHNVFLITQNPPHPVMLAKVRGYPLWPAKVCNYSSLNGLENSLVIFNLVTADQ